MLPVESELYHADRETDMAKQTVDVPNFTNAPKNKELMSRNVYFIQ